ncbi:MAG: HEAT repeat domain-containing protein [Candidatus Eremiobacteraeota bacterium]|nr:HEAT repeat domain-containing protein [Candidatus Eremiobacteraeota bacterium]
MMSDEPHAHRVFALAGATDHYGPDKQVRVEHIDLHLHPDLAARRLSGTCTTTVRALDEAVTSIGLDAIDLQVESVERDGKAATFVNADGKLVIAFDPPLAAGQRADLCVKYAVEQPRQGLFFVGPDEHYPQRVLQAWTQSQDQNARNWFPCLDYPHEKQTTSATIVVPKGQFALSNGSLIERKDEGEWTTFRYEQNVPHPTYLVTLVVGPFVEVRQRAAGRNQTPVSYYVLPGLEAEGERSFGKTPDMIETFEQRIGAAYPYARYSQIAVSEFIFGGMENTSATTQTDRTLHDERAHLDFSSDWLVAHELAHQWFGDLLTCRDWAHAWLNEGFATYFEAVFRERDLGYDEYVYDIFGCVGRYLSEDADRYRRPIVYNRYSDPIELFDRHLYEKGAAVLHMLRGELGEERFWRAIAHYVAQNSGKNVETIDLIRAIEDATGRNMRGFFDRWVFRGGHPELRVSAAWDEERKALTVTVDQTQHRESGEEPFVFDAVIGVVAQAPSAPAADFGSGPVAGERRIRMTVDRDHSTIAISLERRPDLIRFDPGGFVLADVTYALDASYCIASLRTDPDPIARIRAVRALAKDASRPAREALSRAFANEPFFGVLVESAAAAGATRAPWARALLLRSRNHAHPKVRAAVVKALGNFTGTDVASGLLESATSDASYFVCASAYHSLGKTRDALAFDALLRGIGGTSWNATVQSGAARGLSELRDERATAPLIEATRLGRDEGLRRAAVQCLARQGALVDRARTDVVEAIRALLDDPMFLIQVAAIGAAEHLEDARLLPELERLGVGGVEGRVRRSAMEAAIRIREAQRVPEQVATMRSDLDKLRDAHRKLQDQIEALSPS